MQEVRSGSSYCSQHELVQHFGLGGQQKIDWVELRWPSGLSERFPGGPTRQALQLVEGQGERRP